MTVQIDTSALMSNTSYLCLLGFGGAKQFNFKVQSYNIPGLTLSSIQVPSNTVGQVYVPDDVVTLEMVQLSVQLTETLSNYLAIRSWAYRCATQKPIPYASAVIGFTDNDNLFLTTAKMAGVMPTSLSSVTIDHTQQLATPLSFQVSLVANVLQFLPEESIYGTN